MGAPRADGAVWTDIAGERVALMPQRAIWWERERTLLVADLHLGKPATFRAMGIPVPEAPTHADLARLSHALSLTGATRLVLLGDLLHARRGRADGTMDAFASWRQRHAALGMVLVRGNHDVSAGDPPREWGIDVVSGPAIMGSFVMRHEPEADDAGYVLCGHLHPAVRLYGPGRTSMRACCFWVGRRVCVLPAFGSFTGGAMVSPVRGDRVFAVGDGEVVEVRLEG